MNLLFEKAREVTRTLLAVVLLVVFLCFTAVNVQTDVLVRFLVGSVMLLIGLSVFLWGVELAMNPIGEHMGREVATSKTFLKIAVLSFLMGFLVTVAEPDLLILGSQIEAASGGTLNSFLTVYVVSTGVGVLVSLGVFWMLRGGPLNQFMAMAYGVILVLVFLVSEEFIAISFDASGATTGALTTPFALALWLGLSRMKGSSYSEENAFGLVGIMSAGPILAITLMSIITKQRHIQGNAAEFVAAKGVLGPIIEALPSILLESLAALLPISLLFFAFNFAKFKLRKDELSETLKGLTLCLLGLLLFLTAVNSGFMDMGRIIGMEIARKNPWLLVATGFVMGLIVVLAEPAVHVLSQQVEEVTGGHIPINLIRMTLSAGVAMAIGLSMVRILVPAVKIWYFLVPGFAIAILLSFLSEPIFVGIAYDAGGVASGPMTATFVLAFAQGAASVIDTANVMVDGFGVIAMVAMSPVLSIMILGTVFKHKRVEYPTAQTDSAEGYSQEEDGLRHDCVMVVTNRGFAEQVIDLARQSGATGATIIHGRGTGAKERVVLPIINVELQPEKEIILLIINARVSRGVTDALLNDKVLGSDGQIAVFMSPTDAMIKDFAIDEAGEQISCTGRS